MEGREFVIPEDVLEMAQPVLSHRLVLSPEARMDNKTQHQVIETTKSRVPIPTGIKS
jgi:MoxR-like ATPase